MPEYDDFHLYCVIFSFFLGDLVPTVEDGTAQALLTESRDLLYDYKSQAQF